VNFTEEWQHFSKDIEVDDAMAKGDNGNGSGTGLLTIAFNLQEEKSATDYRFDNFGVWYEKPVEIKSMAIVGDFLGLATEENPNADWDPANGWAMEQDAENPAIWSLTKPFTAEAKKYEYKAIANGNWDDYVLPGGDNANFVFGTDEYPAGDYNLVFTANTESNTLVLVVKPATIQTFTATFTTNAYWWEDVYAYAWTEDGENVTEYLGAWPGTKLKANAEGVYTVNVEGEVAPAMICFSNGNTGEGNQTEDLAFVEGEAYQYVFTPTFDFENNNGQWADGTTTFTMDGITLTGNSAEYKSSLLSFTKKGASIKLTAPEGKSIVKLEFKVPNSDRLDLTPSKSEVASTKVVNEGESVAYSIWTWTGNDTEVSFELTGARNRNLGFINVTLEDYVAPEPEVKLYVIGDANGWDRAAMTELTFDETANTYKYEIDAEKDFYFAFANYQPTKEELDNDGNWSVFNNTYRFAIGEGDQTAELDQEYQLVKVNGTIKLAAGKYNVYVTKDLKMTIKDATTDGINFMTIDTRNAVIYNLNGQRVMNAQKGLFIVNGKKVVIK